MRYTANRIACPITPQVRSKLIVIRKNQAIQTQKDSLWRQPRLGDTPFGALPYPAFTIGGWRYTANHNARPITPQFPSRLILNITKQTIQTQNGSLWHQPFGALPRPAFTIGSWQYTANHTARPITPQFPSRLILNITKQTIQTQNGSLWHQPFGALPRPAFTIGGWRYTANHTAHPITPQFPSRLIVKITKQTIQTQNDGL